MIEATAKRGGAAVLKLAPGASRADLEVAFAAYLAERFPGTG